MCLILFSYKTHPKYKLILAANRDEYYYREARQVHWRGTRPNMLAGQDLHAGGTWMGITKAGRFAALTNYRSPADKVHGRSSRGLLVSNFLESQIKPAEYVSFFKYAPVKYNGYNVIFGDIDSLQYFSNKTMTATELDSGIYGLSNHLLDTEWPKVVKGKEKLAEIISGEFTSEDLLDMLRNEEKAPENQLPDTGVDKKTEMMLSSIFIKSEKYGTRCSTTLLIDYDDNATLVERTFLPSGTTHDAVFWFEIR